MWTTIGIGSLPRGLTDLPRFALPTRPQWTDVQHGQDMFAELEQLLTGDEPGQRAVRKAQLPGPATLAAVGRPVEDAALVRAVGRLRALHPRLVTVWFDEPVLGDDDADYGRLDGLLTTLSATFPKLHWGVHTCGPPRVGRLVKLPLTWISIDVGLLAPGDAEVLRASGKRIAWGLVPTTVERTDEALMNALAGLPADPSWDALTTSCGLGTLSHDVARARLAQLWRLAAG